MINRTSSLGERLVEEWEQAAATIAQMGASFASVHTHYRHILLPRFPFAIYYRVQGDEAFIILLQHTARDPDNLPAILRCRDRS